MMMGHAVNNRAVIPASLTDRQSEAASLVQAYYAISHEIPSTGWLSRRLNISRQRAHAIMDRLRDKKIHPLTD